jgi:hypothetical protein
MAKSLSMRIIVNSPCSWFQKTGTSLFFFLLLLSAGRLSAAIPPITGTTTFDNSFSAVGNLLGITASPGIVNNAGVPGLGSGTLATGWDFIATSPGHNVSIAVSAAGALAGGPNDFCIRMNALTPASLQSATVKSDDGSVFGLKSVFLKLNAPAGPAPTITLTGYRGVTAVTGATAVISAITSNSWVEFNVSSNTAFANVDRFVFTQTSTNAVITFMSVDQITIGVAAPLPLTLINFSGRPGNNGVLLQWTTASEQNTSTFEIQRNSGGPDFLTVGQTAAAGNSSSSLNYQYTDNPPAGSSSLLYRLKMIDLDGRFTYSPVLKMETQATGISLSVYPNPFRQQTSIAIASPVADNAFLTLSDMSGRILVTESRPVQQGNNLLALPAAASLPKGIYLLTVMTSGRKQTLQVVKLE